MTFYHYTSKSRLERILEQGVLLPSESNVGAPWQGEHVGPDVVWLLDTPTLTFDHGLLADKTSKNEAIIAVDVPAIRWLDWSYTASMDPEWFEVFVEAGGGPVAAEHWYVFPAPIRKKRWVGVLSDGSMTFSKDSWASAFMHAQDGVL